VSEHVTVSSCGSSFDTVLAVFAGTCGNLMPVAYGCDDDNGPACQGTQASVVFSGMAGTSYYILAGGYGTGAGTLQIMATAALANDHCTQALPLATGVPFTMTTVNATTGVDSAPTCQGSFGKGVWFKYTSTRTGPVPVTTCGSGYDTVLAVYTGGCSAQTPIACNDNSGPSCAGGQASLTFDGTAGTTYYLLAGGYQGQTGMLRIMAGPRPQIHVNRTAASIVLSWASEYQNWTLQRQQDSGSGIGSAGWENVVNGVTQHTVTPIPSQGAFFRLREP
jgi:hypothetical protein